VYDGAAANEYTGPELAPVEILEEARGVSLAGLAAVADEVSAATKSSVGAPNRTRWASARCDAPNSKITVSANRQRRDKFTENTCKANRFAAEKFRRVVRRRKRKPTPQPGTRRRGRVSTGTEKSSQGQKELLAFRD
jgi:hypothetical protein